MPVAFSDDFAILKARKFVPWRSVPALLSGQPRTTPPRKGGIHEGLTSQYHAIPDSVTGPMRCGWLGDEGFVVCGLAQFARLVAHSRVFCDDSHAVNGEGVA